MFDWYCMAMSRVTSHVSDPVARAPSMVTARNVRSLSTIVIETLNCSILCDIHDMAGCGEERNEKNNTHEKPTYTKHKHETDGSP